MFSRPVLIGRGLGARARYGRLTGAAVNACPDGRLLDGTVSRRSAGRRPEERKVSGGHSDRVTPVPIPNTEVKPASADGTWGEAPWESRSPPEYFSETAPCASAWGCLASGRALNRVGSEAVDRGRTKPHWIDGSTMPVIGRFALGPEATFGHGGATSRVWTGNGAQNRGLGAGCQREAVP